MLSHRYLLSYLLTTTLFCLSAVSCGKIDLSDYEEKDGEGYTVTFNVKQYEVTDFSTASSLLKSQMRNLKPASELGKMLNLAVFKDGVKTKAVNQSLSDPGFGTVEVTLPEGQYEIVVLIHSCEGNATVTSPDKITFPDNKVTDTFLHYSDLSIDGNTSKDITVSRVVSKYRMQIDEAIPEAVSRMKYYYTGGSSTLSAVTGFGCVNSRQTEYRTVEDRTAGQQFDIYTFPHDIEGTLKMTVTALDKSDNIISEQTYENIPIVKNKMTTHKCLFFGSGGGTSAASTHFAVGGDDTWDGDITM